MLLSYVTDAQSKEQPIIGKDRHYYVAAEDVEWDFAPSQADLVHGMLIPQPWRAVTKFSKSRFIEYTDDTFTKKKPQPEWLGLLGPIIRGEVGDTIYVHFLNRGQSPHSIHSHGVRYDKDSEGAHYAYSGKGAFIGNGGRHTYKWKVTPDSGPAEGEPSSAVWFYHGHYEEPIETNAGLIGPIVITRKGMARPDGSPKDVDREFIALMMIFNEKFGREDGLFHSINGYIFGNLPGLVMNQGERVRWHVMAFGNEQDNHTFHWHGDTVKWRGRNRDVVQLMPAQTETVDMIADNPGTWMLQCHVSDHMESGMMALYTVRKAPRACPVQFEAGEFWKFEQVQVRIRNTTKKPIERMIFETGAFSSPNGMSRAPVYWPPVLGLASGAAIESHATAAVNDPKAILGWALFPTEIKFKDGTSWQPREYGECFKVFWKDPNAPQPTVLPTFKSDDAEDHGQMNQN